DLAIALCDHAPELGILIARGCLSATRETDAQLLLQRLEEAGDKLQLPPDDPAWEIWDAVTDARLERQLADAKETGERQQVADEADDEEEALATESARGVLLPRIGNRAAESLRDHPPRIAGDALRRIGELAAGDTSAWGGVKQAKDMPRPLLMCRIGIHYRLL